MTAACHLCTACSMLAHSNIAPAVCAALQTALNAGGCIQRPASSSGAASRPGSGINNSHSDAAAPSLVAALVLALLNFSYSSALCKQLLKAGLLPLMVKLMQMLVPCNDTSSPSKLLTQVGTSSNQLVQTGVLWGTQLTAVCKCRVPPIPRQMDSANVSLIAYVLLAYVDFHSQLPAHTSCHRISCFTCTNISSGLPVSTAH